ncbi:retrovirus-related pol polyprotein from transposon TNT 1-94, partial [Tanacetum coccineum]
MNNKSNNIGRKDNRRNRNENRGETNWNDTSYKKVCTGCGQEGYLFEQCFERIGYPDWYKGKKAKKNSRMDAHVNLVFDEHFNGETPFDMGYKNEGDCILVATYLINKVPMEVLVTTTHKDKFDNRGVKCILLGYPLNQKGYRLYNLESGEVFNSRDVVFEENVFPFKHCNKSAPSMPKPNFPTFGDEENPTLFTASALSDVNPNTLNYPNPLINDPVSSVSSRSTNVNPSEQVRRSTRQITNPVWYKQVVQYTGLSQAMDKELAALEKNNTWTLTVLPPGHKPISSKWVYKTKYTPDGTVERLKARLVPNSGLYINLISTMHFSMEGYHQSKHDYSLFVKTKGESFPAALVYVDDILITGNSSSGIQHHKQALDAKFTIKDLGLVKYFLGIEICSTANGTHLNQRKYILDVLTDAGLTAANLNLSPLPTNLKLSLDKGSPLPDPATYRRLVGRLLYLTMTRPDISYVVQHLSQFVSSPKDVYLQAAIHLLKYLKGSISKGIFYTVQPYLKKTGFSDADYASCLMTRKSLTGYC